MAYQRLLKQSCIDKLLEDAERGVNLVRFQKDTMAFEESDFLITSMVDQPDNLVQSLLPISDDDYRCSLALYQAYPKLTPLQAISQQFWDTLAFCDLFPYMQKRWNLCDCDDIYGNIMRHYHLTSANNVLRHGLASLWWSVYLSIDSDTENPYELTEILFKNQTLRTRVFGVSKVIQHKEAALGILRYLKDNELFINSFEKVGRGLSSYFNKLGAVKQLSYLDRDFFYNEMVAHIEEFENYKDKMDENGRTTNEY